MDSLAHTNMILRLDYGLDVNPWILWSITDPKVLNAALRLTSMMLWFEYGLDVEPLFNLIFSTLEGCFDSTGKVYPGSRDRTYYSEQVALWIHIHTIHISRVSGEFILKFPLLTIPCDITSLGGDLGVLLKTYSGWDTPQII